MNAKTESFRWRTGFLFLVLAYLLIGYSLSQYGRAWKIPGTHWNWSGKLISLAFTGLVLAASPWLRQKTDLRWRQSAGSIPVTITGFFVFLGIGIGFGIYNDPAPFSGETLLFQSLLPGLDEELAYRGIALALLERAFGQSPTDAKLRYGWAAFVMSLLFGLGHALAWVDGRLEFFQESFAITFCFASMVAVVRNRSGSLLGPDPLPRRLGRLPSLRANAPIFLTAPLKIVIEILMRPDPLPDNGITGPLTNRTIA